jgi:predicted ATPase
MLYPGARLIGRDAEVAKTIEALRRHRIVTLTGPGGIGKTSVALEVGRTLHSATNREVWFVDLARIRDGSLVAQQAWSSISSPPAVAFFSQEAVLGAMVTRSALLILDNCEHVVADAADFARAALLACPEVRILVTSREPLQLSGETRYGLVPLELPDTAPASAEECRSYPALRLFMERAEALDPDIRFSGEAIGKIYEIGRRLEGIPLAIELAAAQLPFLGIDHLTARITGHFSLPRAPLRGPSRQETMSSTIRWSYDTLNGLEKRLLCSLAIFPSGISLDGVIASCGGDEIDEETLIGLLFSLVQKSLVHVGHRDTRTRYELFDSIRSFALAELEAETEAARLYRRRAEWCAILADRLDREGAPTYQDLIEIAADFENIEASVRCTLGSPSDEIASLGARILAGSRTLWSLLGYETDWHHLAGLAIDRSVSPRNPDTSAALLHGLVHRPANELIDAPTIERALTQGGQNGQGKRGALHQSALSVVYAERQEFAKADEFAERALRLIREAGMIGSLFHARVLNDRSRLRCRQGRNDDARDDVEHAASIAAALGNDYFVVAQCQAQLGAIEVLAGNLERAADIAQEMLRSPFGSNAEVALLAYGQLADLRLRLGQFEYATDAARNALRHGRTAQPRLLQVAAALAALRDEVKTAAKLLGFVESTPEGGGDTAAAGPHRTTREIAYATVRERLSPSIYESMRALGATLTPEQAKREALRALIG